MWSAGSWPLVREHSGALCGRRAAASPAALSAVGTVDVGQARLMFWDLGGQEELQSLWDKVRPAPRAARPRVVSAPRALPPLPARFPAQRSLRAAASPRPHPGSESLS